MYIKEYENIGILLKNNRQITISVIEGTLDYQNWFSKIIDLKNWLQVSINQFTNRLEINISSYGFYAEAINAPRLISKIPNICVICIVSPRKKIDATGTVT